MADTPEQSDYTSIQLRIKHWKNVSEELGNNSISDNDENAQPKSLLPFTGNLRQPMPKGIIYNLLDYLELIDWTCLLYTSPSPRDGLLSRMPSSA